MVNSRSVLHTRQPGFTLIELVIAMIIIGILAIAVIPRFLHIQTFEARSFYDQAFAMMRYAQKAAVAQNTNIFFNADASTHTICLSYAADAGCSGASSVSGPASQGQYRHVAPDGVTLSGSLVFSFSPLGRPSQAATLGIVGDDTTRIITVEQETGYVH